MPELELDDLVFEAAPTPRPPTPPPARRSQPVAPTAAVTAAVIRPSVAPSAPPAANVPWGVGFHPAAASSASLVEPIAASRTQSSLPRARQSWWRVTALSAGASAALTFAVVIARSDPASASTASVETAAPIAVSYDPALLEDTDAKPVVVAPKGTDESARVLARRIALRGTRNAAGGLPRLARTAFEEALQHDPSCRPALAGLGRIAFDAGRWRDAADHLDAALRIEPRDAELREMLGKAHEKLGHHRSAARHLRRAEQGK